MKTIFKRLLLAWTACAVFTVQAADSVAQKDLAKLQGEWSMVSGSLDGRAVPADRVQNSKRVCKADETTVTVGGQLLMKAKFTLDPAKKPAAIDYQVSDGPHAGKRQLGIYELSGDTVKFCFASPGQARPTEFTTKPGDGCTASVWKRDKP